MAFDNTVTIVGNVTRDPELRFTPSGAAVATFGLAWNQRSQNARGETEEKVSFFDVTCWRQLAENVAESASEGVAETASEGAAETEPEPESGGESEPAEAESVCAGSEDASAGASVSAAGPESGGVSETECVGGPESE